MTRKKISPGTGTRRKIPIEKIDGEDARHVCFSKRRKGLFSKASDLATLCGAEIVIVINSIADNPYSFGSPNVHQVIDRYLAGNGAARPGAVVQSLQRAYALRWLNDQCMELGNELEIVIERKLTLERLEETLSRQNEVCKLVMDVERLETKDLEKLKKPLDGLKASVSKRINELACKEVSSHTTSIADGTRRVGVARARFARKVSYDHTFLEVNQR